jgi:hypothetical protein
MSKGAGAPDRWSRQLKRILKAAEVDQAVFFAVATRTWQVVAGPVTALLIAFRFAPEVQGLFYTFASLLAMQAVAELGLHWVIIHAASHEWAQLELDSAGRVGGDPKAGSRLASLARLAARWFTTVSFLFVIVAGLVGFLFFSQRAVAVPWLAPWLLTCLLTGLSLAISPWIAVLEGCGQMKVVNRFRLQQAACGHLLVWSAILIGLQIWVVVVAAAVRLAWEIWLIRGRYYQFWLSLVELDERDAIGWRTEIWPLQWRAAVQAPFLFLAHQLFTPIMFHYHGAAVAGAMGMTWAILQVLQQGAVAWPQSHAPRFGTLIARGQRVALDRLFYRVVAISAFLLLVGIGLFSGMVATLHQLRHPIAEHLAQRLLPPAATVVFSLAVLLGYLAQCLNIYLRAHRKAPLFWLSIFSNSLIAVSVWVAGASGGPLAAGCALLAVTALIRLPGSFLIWRHCRRTWYESS